MWNLTHFSNLGGYGMDSRWNPWNPGGVQVESMESRWNPTEICKSDYSDVISHSRALFELSLKNVVYYRLGYSIF